MNIAKKVTWLELFYDLLFVAAVSKATHVLLHAEHESIAPEYIIKFVLIFIPIWWAWVGQTLFNNRYGQDVFAHRIYMILQLFFVLIMTFSLSTDFDRYYVPFFIGYIGSRVLTALQYLTIQKGEVSHRAATARFLGTRFWIGIMISSASLFFDSWVRYLILYAGIAVDVFLPVIGRRFLVHTPINTHHLLERFALFTLILLGESVVSTLAVLQTSNGTLASILFAALAFILVIAIWWQYFENIERKVDKELQTAGQTIIYGHLLVYLSLSTIAASIQLLFLEQLDYFFMLGMVFLSVLLYFVSTTLIFHRYRHKHLQLRPVHLALFLGILGGFFVLDVFVVVPNYAIIGEMVLFFLVYARLASR
ncbi:low temperature requirement protein A [Paenibacillus planticolens]|uniref:Low temperature requirement protein A n=1 Tax=Paenibacillus planticolens TaxID=2654976 RepID=A0ABX1ZPQ9_9BACL|nr:low temperature requirement protein A [Paenibacillus planticolens]NOV02067.1 low temperature requirement protein A [Paenibacillus planticolens]